MIVFFLRAYTGTTFFEYFLVPRNPSSSIIIITVTIWLSYIYFLVSGGRSYWRESGLRYCDGMRLEKFCVKLFTVSGRCRHRRPTTYNIVNGTRWSCDPHWEFPTVSVEKKNKTRRKNNHTQTVRQSYSIKYWTRASASIILLERT